MGPKILIIKKGEHGALLFVNDDVFYAPALPLEEVFDTLVERVKAQKESIAPYVEEQRRLQEDD